MNFINAGLLRLKPRNDGKIKIIINYSKNLFISSKISFILAFNIFAFGRD